MATNSYFRNFDAKNDQELLHSIVTESIKVTGYDVNYIPRTLVNEDTILGEDSISEYKDAYSVEMLLSPLMVLKVKEILFLNLVWKYVTKSYFPYQDEHGKVWI